MKNTLLIVTTLFLASLEILGQARTVSPIAIKKVSEKTSNELVKSHWQKFKRLNEANNLLSVEIIDVSDMLNAIKQGNLEFQLPDFAYSIRPQTISLEVSDGTDFQYYGTQEGIQILLSSKNGRTYGQIKVEKSVFDVQYLDQGYALLMKHNLEEAKNALCGTKNQDRIGSSAIEILTTGTHQNKAQKYDYASAARGGYPIADVLVLFTQAAQNTGLSMIDIANTVEAQWSTIAQNSNVNARLNITGVELINFVENSTGNDVEDDLDSLLIDPTVLQLREDNDADIVLLLSNGNYPGIKGAVRDVGPIPDSALALVQVAHATPDFTAVHEIAHLYGARHQNTFDQTPGYAHGQGWEVGWPTPNICGTVMFVILQDERVPHFSNPAVDYNSHTTGVVGVSNNARIINENANVVKNFRSPFRVDIWGQGSANNGDPLSFTCTPAFGQTPFTYEWRINTGTGFFVVSSSSTLNYTMPYNANLEVILDVTDVNGQQTSTYHIVNNNFLNGGCNPCPDPLPIESNNNELLLFPNPATNKLNLLLPLSDRPITMSIIDPKGAVVIKVNIPEVVGENKLQHLDVSGLVQGMYIVQVTNGYGIYKTARFIK